MKEFIRNKIKKFWDQLDTNSKLKYENYKLVKITICFLSLTFFQLLLNILLFLKGLITASSFCFVFLCVLFLSYAQWLSLLTDQVLHVYHYMMPYYIHLVCSYYVKISFFFFILLRLSDLLILVFFVV